ncbi:hypothetical protein [Streptomyces sp. NPDC004528]|uniref:hypothetical protein n=1 Tax=Streptomyces sp. NPDC004528 TaxID=3154550 RepID=UPI0033BD237B
MSNRIWRRDKAATEQVKDPNARIAGELFTVVFVMTGAVIAILLAFGFDFGNVWALAARLGVPSKVQWLTAPAVTITYLSLMVGQQYLSLRGWTNRELRKPRLWLLLIGVMTYALNCGDAAIRGAIGEAAFDAVMPTLLLMWGELAPWMMRQVHEARQRAADAMAEEPVVQVVEQKPATTEDGLTIDNLQQMIEELQGDAWAQELEAEMAAERKPRRGRKETPLRPTAREFIWKWLSDGRVYKDKPAAAWFKELVAEMGEDAPTIERCRQIMRDEYPVIEKQWEQAKDAEDNVDAVFDEMASRA